MLLFAHALATPNPSADLGCENISTTQTSVGKDIREVDSALTYSNRSAYNFVKSVVLGIQALQVVVVLQLVFQLVASPSVVSKVPL